jgi:protein ImuA
MTPGSTQPASTQSGPVKSEKTVDDLLKLDPSLWRGRCRGSASEEAIDSGFEELNAILPTGGWPVKSVIELVVDEWGNGELQVLLPLMRYLSQQKSHLALVAPPYLPYAPALHNAGIALEHLAIIDNRVAAKDKWWCAEKMLRHGDCGLVLVWPERKHIRTWSSQVRRLQVAATMGGNLGIIFNRGEPADTPVSLRLKLSYCQQGISVKVLKSRFSWQQGSTIIPGIIPHAASQDISHNISHDISRAVPEAVQQDIFES